MEDQRLRPWTIVASNYRIDEPYLRLRADRVELPDGTIVEEYFVRETRGFAIVAALTPARELVLVRQYKHGIGRAILELPAGVIDAGESAADCAARELAEETGYAGDAPRLLRALAPDPTNSNGTCSIFLIENAELRGVQSLDVTETILVETVPLAAFAELLRRDPDFTSAPHVAAGYVLLDELELL